jgi:hypothetical protein
MLREEGGRRTIRPPPPLAAAAFCDARAAIASTGRWSSAVKKNKNGNFKAIRSSPKDQGLPNGMNMSQVCPEAGLRSNLCFLTELLPNISCFRVVLAAHRTLTKPTGM